MVLIVLWLAYRHLDSANNPGVFVTWILVIPLHLIIVFFSDQESHEDTHIKEVTEDLLPQAKVPLFQLDHIKSKKAQAMRKDQTRQEAKLRIRGHIEYPPVRTDKHQSDIVRLFIKIIFMLVKNTNVFLLFLLC